MRRTLLLALTLLGPIGPAPALTQPTTGWFLMLPPSRGQMPDELEIVLPDDSRPIVQWRHYRAFDTARECEAYLAHEREQTRDRVFRLFEERKAETNPEIAKAKLRLHFDVINFMAQLDFGRCLPAATVPIK